MSVTVSFVGVLLGSFTVGTVLPFAGVVALLELHAATGSRRATSGRRRRRRTP
jgi:hypothetical protein